MSLKSAHVLKQWAFSENNEISEKAHCFKTCALFKLIVLKLKIITACGCKRSGLIPSRNQTKIRKKMVPVAPLPTLGTQRHVLGDMAGWPSVS